MSPQPSNRRDLLICDAQLLNKDMANLLVSLSRSDRIPTWNFRLTRSQHTRSKATVNRVTALHQASSSREATEVRLRVLHPANISEVIPSKATHHLSNTTLDPAHLLLASMAPRLQVPPVSMAHHLQVLLANTARLLDLPPGNTSLQLLISKRLQDLPHRPALVTFLARCRISTCLAQRTNYAKL